MLGEAHHRDRVSEFGDGLEGDFELLTPEVDGPGPAPPAPTRVESVFLDRMTHALRTPMTGIVGMSALLLDTALTAEQRDYVLTLSMSAAALMRIIGNLHDMSQIELGTMTLASAGVDLGWTVEEVLRLLAPLAEEKGLEVAALVPPDLPGPLDMDAPRLRQILVNLIRNAIAFTDEGEVTVTVTVEREDEQSADIRISVRDSGIGMSPERRQEVARGAWSEGNGLGLPIVRQLTEVMGGRFELESEAGRGTTVTLDFSFPKHTGPPIVAPDLPPGLRGARILVAISRPATRNALAKQLAWWGFRPETAETVEDALRLLDAAVGSVPYGLMLLDRLLVGSDVGRVGGTTPVILVGATPDGLAAPELRATGAVAALAKPVTRGALRQAVLGVLGKPPGWKPGAVGRSGTSLGLRVLLTEDDRINRLVASSLLKKLGCQVETVPNGRDAVAAIARESYDVVLMDLKMPRMDGLEATAAIRTREAGSGRRVPIIAFTADVAPNTRARCLAGGMDGFLAKPILPADFAAVLGCCSRDARTVCDLDRLRQCYTQDVRQRRMATRFVTTLPERLGEVRAALDERDVDAVSSRSRTLKDACATFGALALATVCAEIQSAATDGDLDGAWEWLARADFEMGRLRATLARDVPDIVSSSVAAHAPTNDAPAGPPLLPAA